MTRRLRLIFLAVAAICCASALGFALLRYGIQSSDEFAAFNHPAEPWALDVHVVSSVALTLVLGFLLGVHALPRLSAESASRASGLLLITFAALMVASGALLPCISATNLRNTLAWTHGLSGTLFALILPWHIVTGRRARRAAGTLDQARGSLRRAPTPRSSASAAACQPLARR